MSALHLDVTRAIASANCGGNVSAYCYEARADCACRLAAAVAVRVVLAEAQRAVEARLVCYAPGCTASAPFCEAEGCWSVHEARADALAALAALGEQA